MMTIRTATQKSGTSQGTPMKGYKARIRLRGPVEAPVNLGPDALPSATDPAYAHPERRSAHISRRSRRRRR